MKNSKILVDKEFRNEQCVKQRRSIENKRTIVNKSAPNFTSILHVPVLPVEVNQFILLTGAIFFF